MFTSNLPWISFSNITIDNSSRTGTVQITLNTKDIVAGKEQFTLSISSANNDEKKVITPYSLNNLINIITPPPLLDPAPIPDPDPTPNQNPTPDNYLNSKTTVKLISMSNTVDTSQNPNILSQEKNYYQKQAIVKILCINW